MIAEKRKLFFSISFLFSLDHSCTMCMHLFASSHAIMHEQVIITAL